MANRIKDYSKMSIRTKYRRRAELGKTKPVKKYFFDEDFFFTWSDELAWLIGLIWADGCLFRNTVEICSKDHDLLEMVEGVIGGKNMIRPKNNGKHWRIIFSSKCVAVRLKEIGLTSAKSKTIKWPNIPKGLEGSFVRGLIDGDGWISLVDNRKNKRAGLHIGICTASKDFFQSICDWYDRHNINYYAGKNSPSVYRIVIGEIKSAERFYNIVYPKGEWSVGLLRKHVKYLSWLNQ